MSTRLSKGGRLIDRSKPLSFSFNGRKMQGYRGDTLASALLGQDQMLLGRSFKYHRPRGLVASGAEEPNALVGLGEGNRFEPNQRVTTTELFEGAVASTQNHWPSLEFDVGAINNTFGRFLPGGSIGIVHLTARARALASGRTRISAALIWNVRVGCKRADASDAATRWQSVGRASSLS